MKKWIVMLGGLVLLVGAVWAASQGTVLHDGATTNVDGAEILVTDANSIGLDVTISGTATVTFQIRADPNGSYTSLQCTNRSDGSGSATTTATGHFQCNVAGGYQVKAPISGCSGCTVSVKGQVSTAVSSLGGTGAVTGWPTSSTTKIITWANSLANAMRIGDGTTSMCHYTDATDGPQIRPCTASNITTTILNGFTWALFDEEGDAAIETVDPDAASTLAMWTYGTAYRPKKSVWFGAGSLSTDGTQCAAPAEVTINSGPKIWTIICTENDASSIYGYLRMPDSWDGGTVTFTHVYIQTAADTGSMLGELSAQCHGNGETVDSTWGSVVELDDAAVTGSNKNDMITSTAVTPAGTCAASDMLYWRWQYDATGNPTTAAATLNHVGFNMEYSIVGRSD